MFMAALLAVAALGVAATALGAHASGAPPCHQGQTKTSCTGIDENCCWIENFSSPHGQGHCGACTLLRDAPLVNALLDEWSYGVYALRDPLRAEDVKCPTTSGELQCDDDGYLTNVILQGDTLYGDMKHVCGLLPAAGRLQRLIVRDNKLYGSVPACVAQMTRLTQLSVEANKLRGALPDLSGLESMSACSLASGSDGNCFDCPLAPLPTACNDSVSCPSSCTPYTPMPPETPMCAAGSERCVCRTSGGGSACDNGLTCASDGVCRCPTGTVDCPCRAGSGTCDAELTCRLGRCRAGVPECSSLFSTKSCTAVPSCCWRVDHALGGGSPACVDCKPIAAAERAALASLASKWKFGVYTAPRTPINDIGCPNSASSGATPDVLCDNSGHVTDVLWANDKLVGTLADVCELLPSAPTLETLSLMVNALSGTVPSCLNQFTKLQALHLNNNYLSGTLPSLSALSSLKSDSCRLVSDDYFESSFGKEQNCFSDGCDSLPAACGPSAKFINECLKYEGATVSVCPSVTAPTCPQGGNGCACFASDSPCAMGLSCVSDVCCVTGTVGCKCAAGDECTASGAQCDTSTALCVAVGGSGSPSSSGSQGGGTPSGSGSGSGSPSGSGAPSGDATGASSGAARVAAAAVAAALGAVVALVWQ